MSAEHRTNFALQIFILFIHSFLPVNNASFFFSLIHLCIYAPKPLYFPIVMFGIPSSDTNTEENELKAVNLYYNWFPTVRLLAKEFV